MILDRYDSVGRRVHGGRRVHCGSLPGITRDVRGDGAVFHLAVEIPGSHRDASAYLDAEGCIAVAHALLDAAKWALPGGVEGCDDRHVREAAEALHDRAVLIEGIDATYDGEVLT